MLFAGAFCFSPVIVAGRLSRPIPFVAGPLPIDSGTDARPLAIVPIE